MEQQAGSVTAAVPTSFASAVSSHAIKPFSVNHAPDLVDLQGDKKIIVCALAAPGNAVPGPFHLERKRRTFWTACASCNIKNKHSIEYLDCNISCLQCSETFKATEVSRPRKQCTTTTENVHSGIVTSSGTMVEPSKMTPNVETPLRKRIKREINATKGAGKHRYNLLCSSILERNIIRGITEDEIKMFLKSKGKNKVIEATIKGNNVKKNESQKPSPR